MPILIGDNNVTCFIVRWIKPYLSGYWSLGPVNPKPRKAGNYRDVHQETRATHRDLYPPVWMLPSLGMWAEHRRGRPEWELVMRRMEWVSPLRQDRSITWLPYFSSCSSKHRTVSSPSMTLVTSINPYRFHCASCIGNSAGIVRCSAFHFAKAKDRMVNRTRWLLSINHLPHWHQPSNLTRALWFVCFQWIRRRDEEEDWERTLSRWCTVIYLFNWLSFNYLIENIIFVLHHVLCPSFWSLWVQISPTITIYGENQRK